MIFEVLGMTFIWTKQGDLHSYQVMLKEQEILSRYLRTDKQSRNNLIPGVIRYQIAKSLYAINNYINSLLFYSCHKLKHIRNYKSNYAEFLPKTWFCWFSRFSMFSNLGITFSALRNVSLIVIHRYALIIFQLPLIMLLGFVFLTTGFVSRYKRVINAGLDNSTRFHFLMLELKTSIYFFLLVYLSLPIFINPIYCQLFLVFYISFLMHGLVFSLKKFL